MTTPPDDAFEEAGRLLAAMTDWARRTLPAPPSGHPGPECQWCPLCQLASVLRGEHPEITDRMAEAGAAITAAVRALVDSAAAAAARPATPPTAGSGPTRPRPRPRSARVQHITLADSAADTDTDHPEDPR